MRCQIHFKHNKLSQKENASFSKDITRAVQQHYNAPFPLKSLPPKQGWGIGCTKLALAMAKRQDQNSNNQKKKIHRCNNYRDSSQLKRSNHINCLF